VIRTGIGRPKNDSVSLLGGPVLSGSTNPVSVV
jgi:hypothetical protein